MSSPQSGPPTRATAGGRRAAIVRTALVGIAGANGGLLPPSLLSDRAVTECFVAAMVLNLIAAVLVFFAGPLREGTRSAVLWTCASGVAGLGLLGLRQGWGAPADYGAMPAATMLAMGALVWSLPLRLQGGLPRSANSFSLWWTVTTAIAVSLGTAGVVVALAGGGPVSSAVLGVTMAVLSLAQHLKWTRLKTNGRTLSIVQPPRLIGTVAGIGGALVSGGVLAAALWLIAIAGWLAAAVLAWSIVSPGDRADAVAP